MTDAGCPDEVELYGLASGTLADPRAVAMRAHIADCATCRIAVAELARSMPVPEARAGGSRYELQHLVATGGMGEVFVALDRVLAREVAIKLLREQPASSRDDSADQQVIQEARALARLAHPNVVAVYDQGLLDGRPFVAMEYVRGRTLRHWLVEATPTPAQVVDTMVQAGRGLGAAHALGIIHRDFKPDNVLVGDDGRARVTDFGLARGPATDVDTPQRAALLRAPAQPGFSIAGTPGYMAPEQLAGGVADERSDLYAFCVTFRELLDGLRSRSSVRQLDRVLARGLSPEPADRHASLDELLAEIEAIRTARGRRRTLPSIVIGTAIVVVAVWLAARGQASGVEAPPGLHSPCSGTVGVCEAPLVCRYSLGELCGAGDVPGVCAWPSDTCGPNVAPVCGCDGTNYASQCDAHRAGVPITGRGPCVACSPAGACPEVTTGGKPTPAFCHVLDGARGVCWPRPARCTSASAPACGWDGQTYASTCEAHRAGMDVVHAGSCSGKAEAIDQAR